MCYTLNADEAKIGNWASLAQEYMDCIGTARFIPSRVAYFCARDHIGWAERRSERAAAKGIVIREQTANGVTRARARFDTYNLPPK